MQLLHCSIVVVLSSRFNFPFSPCVCALPFPVTPLLTPTAVKDGYMYGKTDGEKIGHTFGCVACSRCLVADPRCCLPPVHHAC